MELEGEPVLIGKFAGEANRPYFSSLLKRSARSARRLRAGKLSVRELEDNREHDRELFPKFILTSWEGFKDSEGNDALFNIANVSALVNALPEWMFDDVRNHFSNPLSFIESFDDEVPDEDAAALGNSLPPVLDGSVSTTETDGQ
jgi:hypothetical protein